MIPTYQQARMRRWKYPHLWKNAVFAFAPCITGNTGLFVNDFVTGIQGSIYGDSAANSWMLSNGLWSYRSTGTNYINFQNYFGTALTARSNISISLWVYLTSASDYAIAGVSTAVANTSCFFSTGQYYSYRVGNGTTDVLCYNNNSGNTGWTHFCMSMTGSNGYLWVNGVPFVFRSSTLPSSSTVNGPWYIGREDVDGYYNSAGVLMDDVRVELRPYTTRDVVELFTGGRGYAYSQQKTKAYSFAQTIAVNRRRRVLIGAA